MKAFFLLEGKDNVFYFTSRWHPAVCLVSEPMSISRPTPQSTLSSTCALQCDMTFADRRCISASAAARFLLTAQPELAGRCRLTHGCNCIHTRGSPGLAGSPTVCNLFFFFHSCTNPGPVVIEPSRVNEAWLILAPRVRCKVGDWENQGWLWFSLLAAISYSYGRTLGSTVRARLTWNPMFLFLKSNFVSRKETTGKHSGFHAVFCGQSSISLHSCAQNWGVLLWLLYCFTVEVEPKNVFFFWLLYFFLLFCSLFLKKYFCCKYSLVQRLPSCDSPHLYCTEAPK